MTDDELIDAIRREVAQVAMRIAETLIAVLPKPPAAVTDLPATVKAYDAAERVALVQIDGDTGETWTGVKSLIGTVAAGDRVMVTFPPPHGIFLRTPPFA